MSEAHLLLHVFEGVWRVDSKADEDNVRTRISQGAETIITILANTIPQIQLDVLAIHFDIGSIVIRHRRDIDLSFSVRLCSGQNTRER